MSDPRFARFKTDPRFRKIRKGDAKVTVDDRFKSVFGEDKKKKKGKKSVDKYGRQLTATHESDNLRRFYRLENEDEEEGETKRPDFARGGVLLESSDEEEEPEAAKDDDSDDGGFTTLGQDSSKPIPIPDDEVEIDLDEDNLADLDAQAAEYAKTHAQENDVPETERTRRIAVVNLDWDYVRASHLYKIFSSLVSSTALALPSSVKSYSAKGKAASTPLVARGKVLSVRVYPSQFGKERMAREEQEGPPPEVFKKKAAVEEEINEKTIYETGEGEDYDEDALRKYQLERLRYYYAIVECDTIEAASHIYSELEGTELERSANVFDLSFVPEGMTFDDEPRDEATDELNVPYKGLDFTTDALRHSKVKLTWDEDDPERIQITRRTLSRKELEENDFKAYIASSSDSESEAESSNNKKKANRDKLRSLLLSGGDDALPEGWGDKGERDGDGMDMEITFTPGLSGALESKDETTLEKYQRKMREKKKKRKEEIKEKEEEEKKPKKLNDEFFGGDSSEEEEADDESDAGPSSKRKGKKQDSKKSTSKRVESTAEELALLAASDNPAGEVKHFNMKAVVKAEKLKGRNKKGKKKKLEQENELQEDFSIDIQDDRFKALHEDHSFAIDPTNPRFKKTKGMSALLGERSKRQQHQHSEGGERASSRRSEADPQASLKSLVESVKRKSAADQPGIGKRRKL